MIHAKNIPERGTLVTQSLFAVVTITSIEDLNLQGFQDNHLSQDQISYCHGNGKPLSPWQTPNLSLGKYSKLSAVTSLRPSELLRGWSV